jgi:hypothetical protein
MELSVFLSTSKGPYQFYVLYRNILIKAIHDINLFQEVFFEAIRHGQEPDIPNATAPAKKDEIRDFSKLITNQKLFWLPSGHRRGLCLNCDKLPP